MNKKTIACFLTVFLVLISCSGQETGEPLVVKDAWVREAPGGTRVTAGYMVLENMTGSDEKLIGVSCKLAGKTEIHRSYVDEDNMAHMEKVESVKIPPKQTVKFAPGGYHVMLMSIDSDFNSNETVELELQFEKSGNITVKAEIRGF